MAAGSSGLQSEPFEFVDLFAGIGGFRLGLQTAGGRCVYAVEYDRHARTTYAANFGHEPDGCDIRDVVSLPSHHVLAAGFPCQPFSLAGVSKKASLGRAHGFADQAQGTLFFELQRLIDSSRPPVIVLENVKNLLGHDSGRTFGVIRGVLEKELGYSLAVRVVDARPWVPQHRERTVIVGLRRAVFGDVVFQIPARPADGTPPPVLRSILQRRYDRRYVLSEGLWQYLRDYREKHRSLGHGFGYGLAPRDGITRTLSARYHKDGSEILIARRRGQVPRRLTPRECGRLMGFPDDFKIPVSDTQAYRQFGNAIVVPMVTEIGAALRNQGIIEVAVGRRAASTLPQQPALPRQLELDPLLESA